MDGLFAIILEVQRYRYVSSSASYSQFSRTSTDKTELVFLVSPIACICRTVAYPAPCQRHSV